MTARAALRAATAAEHERVDTLFSRYNLEAASGYRLFLLAQAAAFLPVEAALDSAGAGGILGDWPLRKRTALLAADLAALGETPPPPLAAPEFDTPAATIGGLYVLEGSRLGGALLKRTIPDSLPKSFLDAPQPRGSWRKVLDQLEVFLYRTDLIDEAAESARQVFQRFEAGGLRYLELD